MILNVQRKEKVLSFINGLTVDSPVNNPRECVCAEDRFFSWDNEKRSLASGKPYLYAWSYYNGVVMEGLCRLSEATGEARYRAYAKEYLDAMLDGDTLNAYAGYVTHHGLDCYKTAALLLEFIEKWDESDRYFRAAKKLYEDLTVLNAKYIAHDKGHNYWHCWIGGEEPRYQVWLDGLYMAEPFLARFATGIGDEKQLEMVADRFLWAAETLRNDENGLYWHAANSKEDYCNFCWSRALGWYTMAQVQVIPLLKGEKRKALEESFRRFVDALLAIRDEEMCLWRNLPLESLSNTNRFESSGSSQHAYGIIKAVHDGVLPESYLAEGEKTLNALIDRKLTDAGLTDIYLMTEATGSNNYDNVNWYFTNEGKGVGPFILACAEAMKG